MEKNLSKEAIEELQLILLENYGVENLSTAELNENGQSYIQLGRQIFQAFKQNQDKKHIVKSTTDNGIL